MLLDDLKLPDKFNWWSVRATLEEWAYKLVNGRFQPPGMIALFAMTSEVDGWVACDGASYDNTKFPELFSRIGTTFGGTATTFQVPTSPYAAPANHVWMIKT